MARKNSAVDEVRMAERRQRVADLYLRGWSQMRICKEVGVSVATVCTDLQYLRGQWAESGLHDFNEAKAVELAKIDNMEMRCWEAFDRSQEPLALGKPTGRGLPFPSTKNGRGKGGGDEDAPKELPKRPGDVVWLRQIAWCIETRCKIFGFIKPPELNQDNRTQVLQINWAELNPDAMDPVSERLALERSKQGGGA